MNIKTILIVEDDTAMRESLKYILDLEGFRVLTASNGLEALEILSSCEPPYFILMDVMMPIMDGYQLFEILKKNLDLESIPVLVMSGTATKCEFEGAYAFFEKPFIFSDLIDTLKNRSLCA